MLLKTLYTFLLLRIELLKKPSWDKDTQGTAHDMNVSAGCLKLLAHNMCSEEQKKPPYEINYQGGYTFDFDKMMDLLEDSYPIEAVTSRARYDSMFLGTHMWEKESKHDITERLVKVTLRSGRNAYLYMQTNSYRVGEYKEYSLKTFPITEHPEIMEKAKIKSGESLKTVHNKLKAYGLYMLPKKNKAYNMALFCAYDDASEIYGDFWDLIKKAGLTEADRPKRKAEAYYSKVTITEQYGSVNYGSTQVKNLKDRILSAEDIDAHYMPTKLMVKGKEYAVPMSQLYSIALDHFITDEKGILPVAGVPGTGKTRLLMSMVHELSKVHNCTVLRIDSSLLPQLSDPKFETFISNFAKHAKNPVLWIEDADSVIKTKDIKKGRNTAVSTFLNFIDGPGFEEYGLRAIITFNCDVTEVDPALLRDGRSIVGQGQAVEVTPLDREKCFTLIESKLKGKVDEERLLAYFTKHETITLAEIYNTFFKASSIAKLEAKLLTKLEPGIKVKKDVQEVVDAAIEDVKLPELSPIAVDIEDLLDTL